MIYRVVVLFYACYRVDRFTQGECYVLYDAGHHAPSKKVASHLFMAWHRLYTMYTCTNHLTVILTSVNYNIDSIQVIT